MSGQDKQLVHYSTRSNIPENKVLGPDYLEHIDTRPGKVHKQMRLHHPTKDSLCC
jgi:hypothetical protein